MEYRESEKLRIIQLLSENPQWIRVLKEALSVEEERRGKGEEFQDWEWYEVHCPIPLLHRMVAARILDIPYKTRKTTLFKVREPEIIREAIEILSKPTVSPEEKIPSDLFSTIVGFDNIKAILRYAIEAPDRVGILLTGPPASAKTLMLLELARLPNSLYILAQTMSAAGLVLALRIHQPKYLLIDEIDRLDPEDIGVLNSLLSTGIVCLVPGQMILTHSGIRKISELKIGDKILSSSGEIQEIISTMNREYLGEIVKIKPKYLPPISLTPDHPVRAIKTVGCEVFKKRICRPNCGRHIKEYCSQPYRLYSPEWIPAGELKKKDLVFFPKITVEQNFSWNLKRGLVVEEGDKISLKYDSRKRLFPSSLMSDYNLARFFGWYLSEGSITRSGTISFGSTNKDLLTLYKKTVEDLFPGIKTSVVNTRTTIDIRFHSRLIARALEEDFGKGCNEKKIPFYVLNAPKDFIREFLLAYIQGDGCITSKGISIYSTSLSLTMGIVLLLGKLGIVPSVKINKLNTRGFGKENSLPIHKITLNKRSRNKILERLDILKKRTPTYFEDEKGFWVPVWEIKREFYSGRVYNLETEDNTYACPILVHNCETKVGKPAPIQLDTKVFAAGIRIERLPADLLSRFLKLKFPPYTQQQFLEVCSIVLQKEGCDPFISNLIGSLLWSLRGERSDVREAVLIARLSQGKEERVRLIFQTLRRQE